MLSQMPAQLLLPCGPASCGAVHLSLGLRSLSCVAGPVNHFKTCVAEHGAHFALLLGSAVLGTLP